MTTGDKNTSKDQLKRVGQLLIGLTLTMGPIILAGCLDPAAEVPELNSDSLNPSEAGVLLAAPGALMAAVAVVWAMPLADASSRARQWVAAAVSVVAGLLTVWWVVDVMLATSNASLWKVVWTREVMTPVAAIISVGVLLLLTHLWSRKPAEVNLTEGKGTQSPAAADSEAPPSSTGEAGSK